MEKNVFTNSIGKSFPVVGLSPMEIERIRKVTLDKYIAAGRRVTAPTYETVTVDGTKQIFDHNENTIETAEDRAAFEDYKKTLAELDLEANIKLTRAAMMAVDADPKSDSRWLARMKNLEIPIPSEEFELLTLYVETNVLKSVEDIAGLMTAVLYAGGTVDEVGIAAADAAFRVALADAYRSNADKLGQSKPG